MDINLLPNSKNNDSTTSKNKKKYAQDFEMHLPEDEVVDKSVKNDTENTQNK